MRYRMHPGSRRGIINPPQSVAQGFPPPASIPLVYWGNLESTRTVVSGGKVVTLGDSVGTCDPTQGTAGSRPVYSASDAVLGGRPSMTFSTTFLMSATALPLSGATKLTIAFIFRPTAIAATAIFIENGTGVSNQSVTFYTNSSKCAVVYRNVGYDEKDSAVMSNNTTYRVIATYDAGDATNAVKNVYINGASAPSTVNSTATAGAFADFALRLGAGAAGATPFAGVMVDPQIWLGEMSAAEAANQDAWMKARNGL